MTLIRFLKNFEVFSPEWAKEKPWLITQQLEILLQEKIKTLDGNFKISGNVAIHHTARIEEHAIIKGPAVIAAQCFIASHAYLRGGVFLGESVSLGPGCEVKTSIILSNSSLAHFNFAGDSIIGSHVNMEAGAVIANHYNERDDKEISVMLEGKLFRTGAKKFGAMIGDHSRIGANAVLSPGTILEPHSIVKRLTLVEQVT
jgi:UDP-N-acetylglucosamine diphosphorylase / glucose-1-phosphate thymidylyltransferase / UDP-N-acetylgalactosamine diphosphorylase / glucosamine-1-phosphate N-acetyltransferase / galactosamine-1-phosphate N-acetyltransferase